MKHISELSQRVCFPLEYLPYMFLMVAGEDQDVVQVDKDSPVEEITKHIVNKCLEDGRGRD